ASGGRWSGSVLSPGAAPPVACRGPAGHCPVPARSPGRREPACRSACLHGACLGAGSGLVAHHGAGHDGPRARPGDRAGPGRNRRDLSQSGGAAMSAATQKGMAVIGALLVVAATSVATAAILERQNLLADTLIGERDRVQARWLLRGGVDWARVILQNDARHNAVTLRSAIWAQPIAGLEVRTPDGSRSALFSGLVEDEQG